MSTLACIADISLGYGSPQIPAMLASLRSHYRAEHAVVFETDQSERPSRRLPFAGLEVERIGTMLPQYTAAGMIEYNLEVTARLDRLRPDLVLCTSPFVLPALLNMRRRPRVGIYYMLESLSYFEGMGSRFWRLAPELIQECASRLDLLVCPEENRAVFDLERCRVGSKPLAIVYNSVNDAEVTVVPADEREARLMYSGTLQRGVTYAEYYLEPSIERFPIDLFGLVEGEDKVAVQDALQSGTGGVRYHGYVDARELAERRRRYAYSISMWAPTNEHQRFAAPNKFFEAIADGVPPITAPHPQCKMLVERYDCGIVMRDWSLAAFEEALASAMSIFGTERYTRMVENCQLAVARELNWSAQVNKALACLPKELS